MLFRRHATPRTVTPEVDTSPHGRTSHHDLGAALLLSGPCSRPLHQSRAEPPPLHRRHRPLSSPTGMPRPLSSPSSCTCSIRTTSLCAWPTTSSARRTRRIGEPRRSELGAAPPPTAASAGSEASSSALRARRRGRLTSSRHHGGSRRRSRGRTRPAPSIAKTQRSNAPSSATLR